MELIPGNKYYIVYTEQFCHSVSTLETNHRSTDKIEGFYTFVGTTKIEGGVSRNVFHTVFKEKVGGYNSKYVMFSTKVNYIRDTKEVIIGIIQNLKEDDYKLEQIRQILNN